ncbi:MAG: sulfatase-like hydrolase/transferase [Rikenellaceae bacterium]
MNKPIIISSLLLTSVAVAHSQEKPNIVFILADDIGYTDFGCYGAKLISTPNIDRLATTSARFTSAYSPASTSSPSRYSLLTGEYGWRKGVGILPADAPLTIDIEKNNLPQQLKSAGYKTALVGKWHLGLGNKDKKVDFNKEIELSPNDIGFDYSYYFPATNDRVPTVFIENRKVLGLDDNDPITVSYKNKVGTDPTGKENPELLKLKHFKGHDGTIINGIARIGWMSGGQKARWVDENMSDTLLSHALNYIDNTKKKEPFFLLYTSQNAHEPRVPSAQFRGKSRAGIYGDVIEEFDYQVGEIVAKLKAKGIFDNTIIIITSDNGPMIKEGYEDGALENIASHDPFGKLRGEKYSLYEGGTRVPFIVSWGKKIKKGFVQTQNFTYLDMLATVASITSCKPNKGSLNDSADASKLFIDPNAPQYRDYLITQNNSGVMAVRKDGYKFISSHNKNNAELYFLTDDPNEQNNLIADPTYNNIAKELHTIIEKLSKK